MRNGCKWSIREVLVLGLKGSETELAHPENTISQQIRWLAHEPKREVLSYSGYGIGGYYYNIRDHDSRSTTQNSGVMVEAESLHMSTAKDKNPIYANMLYYGVIEDIWELNYTQFKIPVFGASGSTIRVG